MAGADRRLSTTQAASRLGVHRKTLLKWHRWGWIAAIRTPARDLRGSRLKFAERDLRELERALQSRSTPSLRRDPPSAHEYRPG